MSSPSSPRDLHAAARGAPLVLARGPQVVHVDGRERAIAHALHADGVRRHEPAPGLERRGPGKQRSPATSSRE